MCHFHQYLRLSTAWLLLTCAISTGLYASPSNMTSAAGHVSLPADTLVQQYPGQLGPARRSQCAIGSITASVQFAVSKEATVVANASVPALRESESQDLARGAVGPTELLVRVFGARAPVPLLEWTRIYLSGAKLTAVDVKTVSPMRLEILYSTPEKRLGFLTVEHLAGMVFMMTSEFPADVPEAAYVGGYVPATTFLPGVVGASSLVEKLTTTYSLAKPGPLTFRYDPQNWTVVMPTNGLVGEAYIHLYRMLGGTEVGFIRVDVMDLTILTNLTLRAVADIALQEYADAEVVSIAQSRKTPVYTEFTGTRNDVPVRIYLCPVKIGPVLIVASALSNDGTDPLNTLVRAQNRSWFMQLVDSLAVKPSAP